MENIQDGAKSSEITQSFGVDKWQRKKSRYEVEEFIVPPPSLAEDGGLQLRYGKISASQASANKDEQKLLQDTQGTAGSVLSYLGFGGGNQRSSSSEIGGAISIDASGGLTFADFSQHPEPSSRKPCSSMEDLTLERQLIPQADPLIKLPWPWGKHNLSMKNTSTPENPNMAFAQENNSEEGKLVQSVKNLNITDSHLPVKEESQPRQRKRSGLEQFVSSMGKPTVKPQLYVEEEGEQDEENEKEAKRRISRDNERHLETFNQNMDLTQQNDISSLNNQYSNDNISEVQINDDMYEPYQPLAMLEPAAVNKEKQNKAQESVNPTQTFNERKISVDVKDRKTSLLALVSPFISSFKGSNMEPGTPVSPNEEVNEQPNMSKAVSRFFCADGYEEQRKKSNITDPNIVAQYSEQLKTAESSISNDLASSSQPKVRKRRAKPSVKREMNVWGPSSM